MDDIFYDGHDELYHRAKFGEDRTTRAGCRCENVVFVFLLVFLPAGCREAANCRYCFYSQAKNQVFRPAGDSLHRFRSNFAVRTGTWVRLAGQNFTSIGAGGWECGPQNIKNFHFLVKSRPAGATPLTDFRNF